MSMYQGDAEPVSKPPLEINPGLTVPAGGVEVGVDMGVGVGAGVGVEVAVGVGVGLVVGDGVGVGEPTGTTETSSIVKVPVL
jgi:hypothetical protein